MRSAKDAGTIVGRLIALIVVSFYAISLIIFDPTHPSCGAAGILFKRKDLPS